MRESDDRREIGPAKSGLGSTTVAFCLISVGEGSSWFCCESMAVVVVVVVSGEDVDGGKDDDAGTGGKAGTGGGVDKERVESYEAFLANSLSSSRSSSSVRIIRLWRV